jgi:hypothetical protein
VRAYTTILGLFLAGCSNAPSETEGDSNTRSLSTAATGDWIDTLSYFRGPSYLTLYDNSKLH